MFKKWDGVLALKILAAIALILVASNALLWAEFISFKKEVDNRPPVIVPYYAQSTPTPSSSVAPTSEPVRNASEDPLYAVYGGSEKYAQFLSVCPQYGIQKQLLGSDQAAVLANATPLVYGGLENASFPLTEVRLDCIDGPYELLLLVDAAQGVLLKEFIIEKMRMD